MAALFVLIKKTEQVIVVNINDDSLRVLIIG